MNQPGAGQYFVSGIYALEASSWRWAGRVSQLRLRVADASSLKFTLKFAIPAAVLDHSKPVSLDIRINGRPFGHLRYAKDGVYEFEKPVPPDFLKPQEDNVVTFEIDKPLPPDKGGLELGFILVQAGFLPQTAAS